jgi:excisionase family DNA binding protein
MAQQMMAQGVGTASGPGSKTAATGTELPELLSPGDIANALKVSEGDVLAILESGELAGKKIGSTWRIKRSSLNEYLSK